MRGRRGVLERQIDRAKEGSKFRRGLIVNHEMSEGLKGGDIGSGRTGFERSELNVIEVNGDR